MWVPTPERARGGVITCRKAIVINELRTVQRLWSSSASLKEFVTPRDRPFHLRPAVACGRRCRDQATLVLTLGPLVTCVRNECRPYEAALRLLALKER